MKYFYSILLILFLSGCKDDTYDQSQIDDQIELNLKSDEVVIDAFLGINLRDSMEIVYSKVLDLHKNNKVRDRKNIFSERLIDFPRKEFYYTFNTSNGEVDAWVLLFYTNEKRLYQIWVLCGEKNNKPEAINEIYSLYKTKYAGKEYTLKGNPIYISFKGKRLIRVQPDSTGISIFYTDIEFEKIYEKEEEQLEKRKIEEQNKKIEKTSDDI